MWTNIVNFDKRGNKIPLVKFPKPSLRFAPNFNGVSQYAITPTITLTSASTLSFKFRSPTSFLARNEVFIGGDTTSGFFCFSDSNGNYQDTFVNNANRFIDGNPLNDGDPLPTDGLIHEITFQSGAFQNGNLIKSIGAQIDPTESNYSAFPIFDVVVDDGSVYNFPMDDGWANNPTMRNTGSGGDGAFINMTEAAWVEIQP